VVDTLLADYPGQVRLTPGKMGREIQPKLAWHQR